MKKILKWWITELIVQLPYLTLQNFKMSRKGKHFRLAPHYWALVPDNQWIKTWSDGPRLTMGLISKNLRRKYGNWSDGDVRPGK